MPLYLCENCGLETFYPSHPAHCENCGVDGINMKRIKFEVKFPPCSQDYNCNNNCNDCPNGYGY